MTMKDLKDVGEVNCVGRFNSIGNFSYSNIRKNIEYNEVDVLAENKEGTIIKFQIVKADGKHFGDMGKYLSDKRKKGLTEDKLFSRTHDDVKNLSIAINDKNNHYKMQGKDISDVILLLDNPAGDVPKSLLFKIIKMDFDFKEVWHVGSSEIFQFLKNNI